jgi:CubicO group peptidase (beta-lactamase class C family)
MRAVILAVALALSFSLAARAEPSCGAPAARDDGWEIATPASVAVDAEKLCALTRRFAEWREADIHAVLISRHGKLIFEQYYPGRDQHWGEAPTDVAFGPTVPHDLRSITKSVVALLLGIAVDKGWVKDLDQPVLSLLPAYADLKSPEKERIKLRDLLTMSAGFAWSEDAPYGVPENSETQMDLAADPCRYVLEQPIANQPGAIWTYSGGSAALIACVLRQATRQNIDQLAQSVLFDPLQIKEVSWARYPATGEPVAASGLRLIPRDTLKIGQLVLGKGQWRGAQIAPASFIEAATTPQINGPGLMFYGYQFWLGRSLIAKREVDWIAGVGYGGQRLYIVPSLDLVVLVHAGLYASPMQEWVGNVLLNRYALSAAAL